MTPQEKMKLLMFNIAPDGDGTVSSRQMVEPVGEGPSISANGEIPFYNNQEEARKKGRVGLPANPADYEKEGWTKDGNTYTRIAYVADKDGKLFMFVEKSSIDEKGTHNYSYRKVDSNGKTVQYNTTAATYENGIKKSKPMYEQNGGGVALPDVAISVAWYQADRNTSDEITGYTKTHYEVYNLSDGSIMGTLDKSGRNFKPFVLDDLVSYPDQNGSMVGNLFKNIMPGFFKGQRVDWGSRIVSGAQDGFHYVGGYALPASYSTPPVPYWVNSGINGFNQIPDRPRPRR
ncbi:MAG: hypothetical protein MH321_14280 [Leptospiraceae bacterium]|nr:hypothetical protein [Leptospiraceae bacterium]